MESRDWSSDVCSSDLRKPATIPKKNSLCLRIPMKRLLTLTHGRGYRNYGRINAARRGQARPICSPALCAVPIAAKSCITAQAKTLKQGKTILFAPFQGSKGKKFVRRILSAPLSWNRAYSHLSLIHIYKPHKSRLFACLNIHAGMVKCYAVDRHF